MENINSLNINMQDVIMSSLMQNIQIMSDMHVKNPDTIKALSKSALNIVNALQNGNKILLCGNGGSAADCQHMAAEIVGRFETDRSSMPAIALTTDSSILTAIANDYGYEQVFSRQVQGLGQAGDVLIAMSTSGNSNNVINAIQVAMRKNMLVIGFSGNGGGIMQDILQGEHINLCVKHARTARVQEVHGFWIHVLCEIIDKLN
jgi:D-sedoheptulose 7-phosphate isomerase